MRKTILSIFSFLLAMLLPISVYAQEGCTASIDIYVQDGGVVEISSENGDPLPEKTVYEIDEMQTIQLSLAEPGNYIYTIKQIKGDNPEIIYDETEYTVIVSVITNEDTGELTPITTLLFDDKKDKPTQIKFENQTPHKIEEPTPTPTPTDIPKKPTNGTETPTPTPTETPVPTETPNPTDTPSPTPVVTKTPTKTPTGKTTVETGGKTLLQRVQTGDTRQMTVFGGALVVAAIAFAFLAKKKKKQ